MSSNVGNGLDGDRSGVQKQLKDGVKDQCTQDGVPYNIEDVDGKMDLEDALDLIGVGRYTYGVLFICCCSLLAVSAEVFGMGLLITSSKCDLELDTYRQGIIGSVPMIGILVSAHTWGYVADTRGRRFALLVALSGTCTLGLASSFVTHWIALAVLKFLSVIFASGGNAVVYAFLVESAPRPQRPRYVMLVSTSLMLLQIVLATIGYITLRHDFNIPLGGLGISYRPWRLLAQVFALANAGALLMFITCVYESPKFYVSQGREEEALQVLMKIYAINTGNKTEQFPVKAIIMHEDMNMNKEVGLMRSMWNQTAPLFHRKFIKSTLLIMYIAVVAFSTAPPMVIWLPHIINAFMRASPVAGQDSNFCSRVVSELQRSKNVTVTFGTCNDRVEELVLNTLIMFGALVTTIGLLATIFAKWMGKRSVVIALNIISGLCCFLLNHVPGNIISVAVFLFINSNAVVTGIVPAFAVEIYPTYLRSMAVCLTIMAGRGFSFIIINSIGVQIETNCNNFFYFFGAFVISAVLVGAFLPGEKHTKQQNNSKIS